MKTKGNMPKIWKTKGEEGGDCSYTNGRSNVEQQPLTVCKSMQSPPHQPRQELGKSHSMGWLLAQDH